ncbi:MAG: GTPase [Candidatus Zixiibacteriota bacterium]|nr:MAG: GTPase [candidate division Zixibacteria bacterium]
MVSINYSSREVCCKIVYYGPGLSGKTTNLLYVHSKVPSDTRGKMISLATEADRTLYFDFLPINIGTINGFAAKFQLYTVPGQVYYNATRKLVLRGVDGVVFVADSQPDKMDENIESLINLEENLREYGYDINDLPMVIQYNKRDLPGVLPVESLNAKLNTRGWPHFEASATLGNGVFDTLKLIIKLVLDKAKSSAAGRSRPSVAVAASPSEEPDPPDTEAPPEEAVTAPADPVAAQPAPSTANASADTAPARAPAATATEETAEAESGPPPEPARYRPYPGSEQSAAVDNKPSVAGFEPSTAEESEDAAPQTAGKEDVAVMDQAEHLTQPIMSPSLKRRGQSADGKKRGFFKRLFGIK